ncbi:MAG: sel1 repeat family protein [Parachlamydiaceae bacterium]|nr:sel1 repeat family protein [Parachlamydiaceae bacterium]
MTSRSDASAADSGQILTRYEHYDDYAAVSRTIQDKASAGQYLGMRTVTRTDGKRQKLLSMDKPTGCMGLWATSQKEAARDIFRFYQENPLFAVRDLDSIRALSTTWVGKAAGADLENLLTRLGQVKSNLEAHGLSLEPTFKESEEKETKEEALLKACSGNDDNRSKTFLGLCYYLGLGCEVDRSRAFDLFKGGALKHEDQIYPFAQFMVGHCYQGGTGVKEDGQVGSALKAAAQSNGLIYGSVNSYTQNTIQAALRKDFNGLKAFNTGAFSVASQNISDKLYNRPKDSFAIAADAATLYNSRIPEKQAEAIKLYEKDALRKHPEILNFLGRHYLSSDLPKAIEYLKQAVFERSVDGMAALADCYWRGVGVAQDRDEARKLYLELMECSDATEHQKKIAHSRLDEQA